ncbi:MAG: amidohydrolase family protein [Chloroherpetonaceae bacterium]|nr:amidohydrolase [Chthonomonadaceae bacterium]MDW8208481.1 amidohydrolase family protein [Chloroherpetonaceae bacterium]
MEILDVNTLFGPLPIASADLSVEMLLGQMQKHQVKSACTLSTLGLMLDPGVGNAATLAACNEHPELLPVATLNPTLYLGDEAPIASLRSDGFRMIRFFPATQGWPIDFAPFLTLVERLRAVGLPLMIEAERPGDATALQRALADYPAPVILAGTDSTTFAEVIACLRRNTGWYLETSRLLGAGCLKAAADAIGLGRLLFGTSAAYRPIASALQTVRYSGLSEPEIAQLLGQNARQVLGL